MQKKKGTEIDDGFFERISDNFITNQSVKNEPSIDSVIANSSTDFHIGNEIFYKTPIEIILKNNTSEKVTGGMRADKDEIPERKKRFRGILVLIILLIAIVALVVFLVILLTLQNDVDIECPTGHELKIVTRQDWHARPPKATNLLNLPLDMLIISHSVTRECYSKDDCIDVVQYIQDFHMDGRNYSDIASNFLIGGDGYVYEGRGWENVGAHTLDYNQQSIGIMFLGTFNDYAPTDAQIIAGKLLLCDGLKRKKLSEEYKVYGLCQIRSFESPGEPFMKIIKTWKRWGKDMRNFC